MAAIDQLSCDHCNFKCVGADRVLYVVCQDATEVLCGHPGEHYDAKEATGCEWDQLKKEDRFRGRKAYVCLYCGKFGYYGRYKTHLEGCIEPYIRHVPAAEVHRSAFLQCAACGRKRLCKLSGRMGDFGCLPLILPVYALANLSYGAVAWWGLGASLLLLALIWDVPGLRLLRPRCPQCSKGRLRRQMVGIS